MKTRTVDKYKYQNYLTKAEEFYETMNESLQARRFNATVVAAIHCAISSSDALTVFYKGIRHSGERHEDVINVLNTLGLPEMQAKNKQLLVLLQVKNSAEYADRLMTESNANESVKNAQRFYSWVKGLLQK